jgi:large subunit ribosomal protein L17
MRHRAKVQHLSRANGPRKALLRGLVSSLVSEGRIKTTLAKAKELRRHVERAVTVGKRGGVHARRILLSRYPNPTTVDAIMKDLAGRFQERAGGYTRILKLGERPGDRAEMAFIEFVDYQPKAKGTEETAAAPKAKGRKKKANATEAVGSSKDKVKARRVQVRAQQSKRRRLRKIQSASRQEARA